MPIKKHISFAAFFLMWADRQGWEVPEIHIVMCNWLETSGPLAVMNVFRGCGKSTILSVYNAWRIYINPEHRILHQGDQDKTAYKTSRDTKNVLEKHPLTCDLATRGEVEFWWTIQGYDNDPRNPTMQASGILSGITSSRADEIQNDDVEVQKNVETPEARQKLRTRLDEQIHIAVPGAKHLYVGTPHTHNSIYEEIIEMGADHLSIPLFGKEQRFTDNTDSQTVFNCKFKPEYLFVGIGKHSSLLIEGEDYEVSGNTATLKKPPGATLDVYADNAWPERFNIQEMTMRRKKCATFNKWDSQYQLHAKPVVDVRLNPEKIIPYDLEPVIHIANRKVVMMLGTVRIVGVCAWWDCATGKITSDASAFTVLFTDALGRLYLHVCKDLAGDLDAQCLKIRNYVVKYQIPRVNVETNGAGGFVPPILRKHLKGTGCGVGEHHSSTNKNKRILDAWEAPLDSGFLWAHVDVLLDEDDPNEYGPLWNQMLEWNPEVTTNKQEDDYLDSGAGAIIETPVRIGKLVGNPTIERLYNWRENHNQFQVEVSSG